MPAGSEIERKFLVRELPDLTGWTAREVAQGYLAITDDVEVRLRRSGGRHLLTVKSAPGLVRVEEEVELAPDAFARLWPLTEGRRVVKVRHTRRDGDAVLELDVYGEQLDGLLTLEVEFADRAASDAYVPPPWAGPDVTGDRRYANQALAVDGVPRA